MSLSNTSSWGDAEVERLLAPTLSMLAEPTALSTLDYDLNAGVPDRDSLPAAELAKAAERAIRNDPGGALTYGGAQGYEPLRTLIAEKHFPAKLKLGSQHISLCSGSAHAIDNIAGTFIGPGDTVVVGAPTYPGAIRAFRARGAQLIDVPQDASGLRTDLLAELLGKTNIPPKLIYLIPTYDNPSGSTMPLEKRHELLQLAEAYRLLVVEDDAYAGLDLGVPPPPSLFELAGGRGVIHVGTASKTIATGLRLGWTVAAPEITRRLVFSRLDNGGSPLIHRTVFEYLRAGTHEEHLLNLRAIYQERRDAAAVAVTNALDGFARFDLPAGGFYLWLQLSEQLNATSLVESSRARGVAVTSGQLYFANSGGEQHIRIAYPALSPDDLQAAIKIIGEAASAIA